MRVNRSRKDEYRREAEGQDAKAAALDRIGTVIVFGIIVLCLMISLPRIFGVTAYTVLSGSMEPEIPVGSAIYVSAVDPETLEAGDVIVFMNGRSEVPVAHRVIENRTDAGEVVTKGDANEHNDPDPIPYGNILGKVRFHLPRLGKVLALLGSVTGKLSLIALALAGTLLCAVSRLTRRRNERS